MKPLLDMANIDFCFYGRGISVLVCSLVVAQSAWADDDPDVQEINVPIRVVAPLESMVQRPAELFELHLPKPILDSVSDDLGGPVPSMVLQFQLAMQDRKKPWLLRVVCDEVPIQGQQPRMVPKIKMSQQQLLLGADERSVYSIACIVLHNPHTERTSIVRVETCLEVSKNIEAKEACIQGEAKWRGPFTGDWKKICQFDGYVDVKELFRQPAKKE